jgi:hypothetical protein
MAANSQRSHAFLIKVIEESRNLIFSKKADRVKRKYSVAIFHSRVRLSNRQRKSEKFFTLPIFCLRLRSWLSSKTDREGAQDGKTTECGVGRMPLKGDSASWPSTETCSGFISASLRVFVEKTGR